MTLRVSGKNMDVGEALRTKAQQHFDTVVGKYFDGGYEGHLTLALFIADTIETHLRKNPKDRVAVLYRTNFQSRQIEEALRRYNRKLKAHRKHADGPEEGAAAPLELNGEADEPEEDYAPAVVAETTSSLRLMSVGEAVTELDLLRGDVVVFRHAGHGGLNVVYRRADGNIGWIDPALGAN